MTQPRLSMTTQWYSTKKKENLTSQLRGASSQEKYWIRPCAETDAYSKNFLL